MPNWCRNRVTVSGSEEDISKLSEIFSAVDENIKTVRCIKHLKKGCNGKSIKCNTHKLWDELDGYINSFFEKKLLSDLAH